MAKTTTQGSLYKYDEYDHSYRMSNSESSVTFEVAIFIMFVIFFNNMHISL